MNLVFKKKKISALLAIVPANERTFEEDMAKFNFTTARSLKLKKVMGYDRHRVVNDSVCVSDLACFGLQFLFDRGHLERDDFDALVMITQSPDYFMPPTSNVIQGRMNLKRDMLCLDINQGCAGFLIGLMQGFLLLDQPSIKKVVLINADVLSRKVSIRDRNSYPLIGDAASIAILERSDDPSEIPANLKMDGSRCEALMIPAGGFRLPSSGVTSIMEDDGENNFRAKDNLRMDGTGVFNFVQVEVPPMIADLLRIAKVSIEDIDYFIFHQPNKFMLQKLADKMKIAYDKMPSNIVELYGNSSGVTIPLAMAHNLSEYLIKQKMTICFAGFGVGLTWASMLLKVGPLTYCEIINYP